MKRRVIFSLGLCLLCLRGVAGVLPPEKLLPKDTLMVVTVLEAAKSWETFTNSTYGKLWNDPSMKPFRDNFVAKWQSEFVGPAEKELGIRFADYQRFAQGQLTFAVLLNDPKGEQPFSPLLLLDAKDQAEQLKKALEEAKKKWVDAGKPIKTVEIRGIPFTTFITSRGDLTNTLSKVLGPLKPAAKAESDDEGEEDKDEKQSKEEDQTSTADEKVEVLFGQSDSLLIVGESAQAIEKVLNRQAGGLIPALEEEPSFHADYEARLRGVPMYAWINLQPLLKELNKPSDEENTSAGLMSFNPQKVMTGFGLFDLKTVVMTYKDTPEGCLMQGFLGIPQANRRGIFKLLTTEAKDSAPPPFVPADVCKYTRWRLDLPQTWNQLEDLLSEINPAAKGILSFVFDSAGKAKDPNYNLKSELLGSLGNDVIIYQKNLRSKDAVTPPVLVLIGSPKPESLASALNVAVTALLPTATLKTTEFQGRTIYSVTSPQDEKNVTRFAANGGYLAFSSDSSLLEEYLRSTDNKPKALAETAGLNEAAQKVGGMSTGLFGYTDQREELKVNIELVKKKAAENPEGKEKQWADYSLLPSYDAIAKYFYYSVYSVSFNGDGFTFNHFAPNPPQVKEKAQ